MNLLSKFAAPAALLFAGVLPAAAAGISASATYTAAPDAVLAGVYDYSITLNNTGTTNIGEFWFGWIPGAGFLSVVPSKVGSPAGWTETQTNAGAAIQWIDNSTLLAAGQSLTGFTFSSTETPTQLLSPYAGTGTGAGDPQTTAFVYIVTKVATDPGYQLAATPAAAPTPEPASLVLALTGFAATAATRLRSRFRR